VVHLECGQYLLQKDLANAQVYCDSFVTPLEEFKAEAGVYPARLSLLPFYADQKKAEADKTLGTRIASISFTHSLAHLLNSIHLLIPALCAHACVGCEQKCRGC
jgi:hypothetical protein